MHTKGPDTIESSRITTVRQVVCRDGSAHLLGVVVADNEGAKVVGNGTVSTPLTVQLTPVQEAAPLGHELAERILDCAGDCPRSVVKLARAFMDACKGVGE